MTVEELLAELEDVESGAEIRLAIQPRWAFEYSVQGVYVIDPNEPDEEDEDTDIRNKPNEDEASDTPRVVYLVEGTQLRYLPKPVSRALGWK